MAIHVIKVIPKPLFGRVVCWRLGYQRKTTTHFPEESGLLALPPKAARPKNHDVPKHVWFFGLGTQASKKSLGPKNTSGSR